MNQRDAARKRFARVVEADRRWFDRHPERRYLVRQMAEAELRTFELEGAPLADPEPGYRWWVVAKLVRPGHRLKVYFIADARLEADQPEASALRLYWLAISYSEELKSMEAVLTAAASGAGGEA